MTVDQCVASWINIEETIRDMLARDACVQEWLGVFTVNEAKALIFPFQLPNPQDHDTYSDEEWARIMRGHILLNADPEIPWNIDDIATATQSVTGTAHFVFDRERTRDELKDTALALSNMTQETRTMCASVVNSDGWDAIAARNLSVSGPILRPSTQTEYNREWLRVGAMLEWGSTG